MSGSRDNDPTKTARDLAEGFSAQSRHSNKVWLALIAASILAVFPDVDSAGNIKLPFALGSVDADTYKVVGLLILAVLLIGYCQTYAAAHVAARFARGEIAKTSSKKEREQAQKIFELHLTPTLSRVAPLVELVRLQWLAAPYYVLLKALAVIVILGIPSAALFVVFVQLSRSSTVANWLYLLALAAILITCLAVLQMLVVEVRHTARAAERFWTGQWPEGRRQAPK